MSIIQKNARRLIIIGSILASGSAKAQDPISIIKQGVSIIIRAADLQIQRIQTKTIFLEEAQKVVENAMSQLDLEDIRTWVQAQKDLYGDYFQELWRVKSVISYYERIATIIRRQEQILSGSSQAMGFFRQSGYFNLQELSVMEGVYGGILHESIHNLDALLLVINSFQTQMTDAQRMALIDEAGDRIDKNFRDLGLYNNQNALIARQREAEAGELTLLQSLYGL